MPGLFFYEGMMNTERSAADHKAAELVQAEVGNAISKWGNAIDAAAFPGRSNGELLQAAVATGSAVIQHTAHGAFPTHLPMVWPKSFDPQFFRDYGSNIANLVVMGAYIQNEIARRIVNGEPTTRVARLEEPTPA